MIKRKGFTFNAKSGSGFVQLATPEIGAEFQLGLEYNVFFFFFIFAW